MIEDIEDFFTSGCGRCERFATPDCSVQLWQTGLLHLRRICLDTGLGETVRWGHPCYVHAGRNIAIIGAHRGDFRLSFFNAALMKDPGGVLRKQGPNTRHADMFYFTDNSEPERQEILIRAYLTEAMGYADEGIRPPKEPFELDLPEELIAAMDDDPELAEAFHALTPGRQKSYVILLNGAKTSATRIARIARSREKILAGKGAMER